MNMEPTTLLDGDELLMLEESFRTNQRRRQSNESVATMMSIMTLEDDDDRSMDLEEMERMLTLEGELEPEPLSPEEDELIASASSALLAASPTGPSPTERLRSSWAGHHFFPSPAATASPTAVVSNPSSRAAGHRASSHELLLSSAASRQWQAIASSPAPAPAPTNKMKNSPSRDSSHKDSSIARSPTAGMSSGSGAGATTTPQLPSAQQLSQEDVLLRRLAASMQRSGETRSRLFLHSSTTTTNTSPSIPSNAGHLEPGGRICQKMTSAKEPLAPVLPAMVLDGQGCMTMGGKKSQEQGAALPQKCLSAADATTTTTTTTTMNRVAPTQSILRLSGFLAGDLKTLTSGLEHSRNMVQRHGSLLARTSGGMGHVGNVAGVGGTTSV